MERIRFIIDKTVPRITLMVGRWLDTASMLLRHTDTAFTNIATNFENKLKLVSADITQAVAYIVFIIGYIMEHKDEVYTTSHWTHEQRLSLSAIHQGIENFNSSYELTTRLHTELDICSTVIRCSYYKGITLEDYTFTIGDDTTTLGDWCFEEV
jgi:hypothetical protein